MSLIQDIRYIVYTTFVCLIQSFYSFSYRSALFIVPCTAYADLFSVCFICASQSCHTHGSSVCGTINAKIHGKLNE